MLIVGEKVMCEGYMKKVNDGAYIERIEAKCTKNNEEMFMLHSSKLDEEYRKELESKEPMARFVFEDSGSERLTDMSWEDKYYSPCEGDNDLHKTYYEYIEKRFSGIYVGTKSIVASGWLGVDTYYDHKGAERHVIFKNSDEVIKCAVVYFGNNRKRIVPIDKLKEIRGRY